MNSRRLACLSLLLALALAACAPFAAPTAHTDQQAPLPTGGDGAYSVSGGPTTVDNFAGNGAAGSGVADAETSGAVPPDANKTVAANAAPQQGADRLVIKTANLALVVNDPSDAAQKISALATGLGGFVVNSSTSEASVDSQGNKIMQANLTVRVPANQLDGAVAQIRQMAVEVQSVNVAGQDVTAQYTDLQSQLRNAEAAEAKLTEIMNDANKTEDVLTVFNQLTAVQAQVEQLKGQIQYYEESASMSAISVTLTPNALIQPIEVGGWQPQGVAKDALAALLRAFQGIATGAIWVGLYILPLALIIGLPLYAVLRLVARRVRKPKTVTA